MKLAASAHSDIPRYVNYAKKCFSNPETVFIYLEPEPEDTAEH